MGYTFGTSPVLGGSGKIIAPNGLRPGNILTPYAAAPDIVPLRRASDLTAWTLSNSGTAATATLDPNSPFGVPAIRLDIPNGNTYAQLTSTGLTVPGYNGAPGNLVWVIYVDDSSIVSQCQSILGDSGFVANDTVTRNMANSDLYNNNGYLFIQHPKTLAFAVTDLRIRVFGGSVPSGSTAKVWVLGAYIPKPAKPFIILTFDDADVSFYTKALPILQRHGVHATFGVNKDQVGSNDGLYVNEAKLDEIYNAGNDLSSHNLTNTSLLTQGVAQYAKDFEECASWMRSKGWVRGQAYHPFVQGKHSAAVLAELYQRGVRVARNATSTDLIPREALQFGSPYLLPITAPLSNATTLAAAKAKIDDAITYSMDACFMAHILGASQTSVTWIDTEFAELVRYAVSKVHSGQLEGVGSVTEWATRRGVNIST